MSSGKVRRPIVRFGSVFAHDERHKLPTSLRIGLSSLAAMLVIVVGPRSTFGQFGGGEKIAHQRAPTRFDSLVRVITATVLPNTWSTKGGLATIEAVDEWGLMIVSHTAHGHEEIENLLTVIRRARDLQSGRAAQERADYRAPTVPTVSLIAESSVSSTRREQIEKSLSLETEFDVTEVPLLEFAALIHTQHGVPVHIDVRALEEVGLGSEFPVTAKHKDISLRSALRLTLQQFDLSFYIRSELLIITTPEEIEDQYVTRVYLVNDLAVPKPQSPSDDNSPILTPKDHDTIAPKP